MELLIPIYFWSTLKHGYKPPMKKPTTPWFSLTIRLIRWKVASLHKSLDLLFYSARMAESEASSLFEGDCRLIHLWRVTTMRVHTLTLVWPETLMHSHRLSSNLNLLNFFNENRQEFSLVWPEVMIVIWELKKPLMRANSRQLSSSFGPPGLTHYFTSIVKLFIIPICHITIRPVPSCMYQIKLSTVKTNRHFVNFTLLTAH